MDRLLDLIGQARTASRVRDLDALAVEVDSLAADAVRYARERDPDARTMSALAIAIETARATLSDGRRRVCGP